MDKKTIKKIDELYRHVDEVFRKDELMLGDYVTIYDKSRDALELCHNLQEGELLKLCGDMSEAERDAFISKLLIFKGGIIDIRDACLEQAADLEKGMIKVVEAINYLETGKKLLSTLAKNFKVGDGYYSPELMNYHSALAELERQRSDIEAFFGIARIMCDIFAAQNVESEEYKKYRNYYNKMALFFEKPNRGYASEDWPRMCLEEVELIMAEIEKRLVSTPTDLINSLLCYSYKGLMDRRDALKAET